MNRVLLTVFVLAGISIPVVAQDKAIDEVRVRQLVRQLEARGRDNRDNAEAELRELGPKVLSLLPQIDARTGGELKQRLLRIRDHLEKQQLAESANESRLTLRGTMTLTEAFSKIEEQTGNTVVDYRGRRGQSNDNTEVTLDLEDVPFWEALDRILDDAGLTVFTFVGEPRKLAVVAAEGSAAKRLGSAAYSGLFRVEPTTLSLERNLRNPGADIFRMNVEMLWEPRVLPIQIRQDLEDIELTTDNGETLSVASTGTIQLPVQPGVASVDIRLPLSLPSRDAKEIKSLKGRFTALVPGGDVTFEFTNLADRNVSQRKAGITVVLDQVFRNDGVQQINVILRLDQAGEALQSHLDWVENNVVRLVDPNGNVADEPGYEKYRERDSEVGYSYIFPIEEDLDGWKLIYTTPAGIAEVPVEYEVENIALP